jgi:hypothetical protein
MSDSGVAPQSRIQHRFYYLEVHHDPIQNAHIMEGLSPLARLPVKYLNPKEFRF